MRIVANRVMSGLPACSASSARYSNARSRVPTSAMIRMAPEVGRNVHGAADDVWHWNGREVFLVDATGLSMLNTVENQLAFPQIRSVKQRLGFPIMRAVAMISVSTDAVVDFALRRTKVRGLAKASTLARTTKSSNG